MFHFNSLYSNTHVRESNLNSGLSVLMPDGKASFPNLHPCLSIKMRFAFTSLLSGNFTLAMFLNFGFFFFNVIFVLY